VNPPNLPPLGSKAVFEDWISLREKASYDPLSREAAKPYAYIWKSWCDWLATKDGVADESPVLYTRASEADMQMFLHHGCTPASTRKGRSGAISPVTRQRYGRVLHDIYEHARHHCGFTGSNPVTEVAMGEPPTTKERGGQILPPGVFESLYRVFATNLSPFAKRDRAIILLLLECGLTSGEIRQLKQKDVTKNTASAGQFLLRLDGPRLAQDRTISTTGAAGHALHQWLVYRKVMKRKTDVVFVSEKRGAMTRRALFGLTARMITLACERVPCELPNHIGPMVIRNTCVVRWYNAGKPVEDICRDAGFKDVMSFRRGLGVHLKPATNTPLP
jgi:site-specific recombinase XerD